MYRQVKKGEIYYCDLSPVVGSEQGGCRPVLILQNNMGNKFSPTTIVAIITTAKTKRIYLHITGCLRIAGFRKRVWLS